MIRFALLFLFLICCASYVVYLFKKSSELERKVEAAREDLAAAQKKRKLLTKLRDILVEKRAAEKEIIKLHVTERTLKNESK